MKTILTCTATILFAACVAACGESESEKLARTINEDRTRKAAAALEATKKLEAIQADIRARDGVAHPQGH